MCRRNVRAILPNRVSTIFNHDPCLGVSTYWKRFGRVAGELLFCQQFHSIFVPATHYKSAVVRQNFSRDPSRGGSWWSRREYDYRLDTARRLWSGRTRVRVERTYIKDRSKIDPDYAARL